MDRLIRKTLEARGERVKAEAKKCRKILERLKNENSSTPEDEMELRIFKRSVKKLTSEIQDFLRRKEISSKTQQKLEKLIELQYDAEEIQTRLEVNLEKINNSKSLPANQPTEKESTHSRLPELQIGTFGGDILKWYGFWDQFNSLIGKRKLDDVDKMMYLRGALQGEALELIRGLELTNANYKIAVDRLTKTYGRPGHVIDAHYRALTNMPKATSDIADCRRTLNRIEEHLSILESMGEKTNANNSLRHQILDKFPNELMYNFRVGEDSDNQPIGAITKHLERVILSRQTGKNLQSIITMETCKPPDSTCSINQFTTESLFAGTGKRPIKTPPTKEPPQKRSKVSCFLCKEPHFTDQCKKFSTVDERKAKLDGRCYICLSKNHLASEHQNKDQAKCFHCAKVGHHHRSLCPKKFGSQKTNVHLSVLVQDSILPTALASVYNSTGKPMQCRILLDTGSQRTYINTKSAKQLKLTPIETTSLSIYSFGSTKPQVIHSQLVTLRIKGLVNDLEVSAHVVPTTTGNIPSFSELKRLVTSKSELHIAPDVEHDVPADIIIGNDFFHLFVTGERRELQPNLYLINTLIGWIVSGRFPEPKDHEIFSVLTYVSTCNTNNQFTAPDQPLLKDNVRDIWELETIGITDSPKVLRDEEVVQYFNKTIQRQEDRYYVKWPWVEYPPELSINLGQSTGRLRSLVRYASTELLHRYDEVLRDQLDKQIIEVIEETELPNHPVHYLPHHGVLTENKTTKLRIVYDGSAKMKGHHSLNELLYKGPSLLEDLTSLLIQFRQHRVGIISDIEKAFLQVGLQLKDRDVTRFLWLKDIKKNPTDDNLLHLRFCRVPFGIICSPFLLSATIRYHLHKENSNLSHKLSDHLYVDNLVTGTDTPDEALELYTEARRLFGELSMNIREWTSNSKQFIMSLPQEQRDEKSLVSVLGLKWDTTVDVLALGVNPAIFSQQASTKRDVLRMIASIFDPCGWCAPYTLPTRIFLQSLWEDKIKWDTPLTQQQHQTWSNCRNFLEAVTDIKIPRFYLGDTASLSFHETENELHCFTDASKSAYVATVYLRSKVNDHFMVNLVVSRSRLTPLKHKGSFTIPKLELLGLLIGTRLVNYVQANLHLSYKSIIVWSDSTIVLSWLKSERLLPPFVSRRISEISKSKHIQFRYIPSQLNPADIATRPLNEVTIPSEWFEGPKFLHESSEFWHVRGINSNISLIASDNVSEPTAQLKSDSLMPCHESHVLTTNSESAEMSTPDDLDEADIPNHGIVLDQPVVLKIQALFFPRECKKEVTPLAKSLGLFLDEQGVLRCKGRFANSQFTMDQKYPILLPKNSKLTIQLIQRLHEDNHHVGVSHTLSLLRTLYWIPQGRAKVSSVLRSCKECIRHGGGPYKLPQMPDLPVERVSYSPPFTYTGLDYLGPLTILEKGVAVKRFCCLFTCMAIRAVHLEVVKDLSCEEFLLCLRRFVAIRGIPQLLVSDNATHFKLASSVLQSPLIQGAKVTWKFIPALSPWQGGFYERMVGLVKHCLYRSVGNTLLGENQLWTVLKEIEATLNSRPLTTVGKDLEPILTPAHFLKVSGPTVFEIVDDPSTPISASVIHERVLDSWKRTTTLLDQFRLMFINQYLTSLREQHRFDHPQPRVTCHRDPVVGDIVQLKGDKSNRAHWKVGRISALLVGSDGHFRTARVTLPCGTVLNRSISHLFPLELHASTPSPTDNSPSVSANIEHLIPPDIAPLPSTSPPQEDNSNTPAPDTTNPSSNNDDAATNLGISERSSIGLNPPGSKQPSRTAARQAVQKIRGWIHSLFVAAVENQCS